MDSFLDGWLDGGYYVGEAISSKKSNIISSAKAMNRREVTGNDQMKWEKRIINKTKRT